GDERVAGQVEGEVLDATGAEVPAGDDAVGGDAEKLLRHGRALLSLVRLIMGRSSRGSNREARSASKGDNQPLLALPALAGRGTSSGPAAFPGPPRRRGGGPQPP